MELNLRDVKNTGVNISNTNADSVVTLLHISVGILYLQSIGAPLIFACHAIKNSPQANMLLPLNRKIYRNVKA